MVSIPQQQYLSVRPPSSNAVISNSVENFLDSLDVAPNSKETYRRSLDQFFGWLQNEQINRPDRNNILMYKQHLIKI